jgi:rod shape-determining protein MreC
MSRRIHSRTFLSTSPQLGVPLSRFALFGTIGLSFFLILWGQLAPASQARARTALLTFLAPVVNLISQPTDVIKQTASGVRSYADLQAEVTELRRQNNQLIQWESAYRTVAAENERLRQTTQFLEPFSFDYKTTRIVTDPGSAYARSLLVEGGLAQGFAIGDAVVGPSGLIGRLVEVGASYSRVMLVTDINARIPVFIEQVQRTALVSGRNDIMLDMRYINQTIQRSLKRGDRVVTSGQGGMYPAGLPVGIVASVSQTGVQVLPYLELDALMEVQVVSSSRPQPSGDLR